MLDSWKEGGTNSRENRNEDVEKNKRSNIERQSKECGHQKGARCEQHTRESKRNETTLVWTHAK